MNDFMDLMKGLTREGVGLEICCRSSGLFIDRSPRYVLYSS